MLRAPGWCRVKPPFTYFGGKLSTAKQIVAMLPQHEHYVEPFCGSLAVLLAKTRSRMETVSDLDGELVNFWRVLRDQPAALERLCALTPHSRAEQAASYDLNGAGDLERARRVWVTLTQGRSGLRRRTGWRYYIDPRGSHSSMAGYVSAYVERLYPAAERIAGVSLECKPALDLIEAYGRHAGNLLYCDPPYLGSLRTWGSSYQHELRTEEEHRDLASALSTARAAVVLSGYPSALYDDLYDGWHRTEIPAFNGNAAGGRERTEVLWSNRPFPVMQADLFSEEAAL